MISLVTGGYINPPARSRGLNSSGGLSGIIGAAVQARTGTGGEMIGREQALRVSGVGMRNEERRMKQESRQVGLVGLPKQRIKRVLRKVCLFLSLSRHSLSDPLSLVQLHPFELRQGAACFESSHDVLPFSSFSCAGERWERTHNHIQPTPNFSTRTLTSPKPQNVLYIMIVNMPSDAALTAARAHISTSNLK